MNANSLRMALQSAIMDLSEARDAAATDAEKDALLKQIEKLERAVDDLDLGEADALGSKIDEILERLQEIQNEEPLDAVSALGRAIGHLRGVAAGGGG